MPGNLRIEEITEEALEEAENNELYGLKLKFLQVWQKTIGEENETIEKRAFGKV